VESWDRVPWIRIRVRVSMLFGLSLIMNSFEPQIGNDSVGMMVALGLKCSSGTFLVREWSMWFLSTH
jgi:hypothetical protein